MELKNRKVKIIDVSKMSRKKVEEIIYQIQHKKGKPIEPKFWRRKNVLVNNE